AASWSLFCLALSPLIVVALSLLYPAGLRRDPHSFPTRRSSDLGEQQLLSIIIPLGLLIAFRVFPFADDLGGMDAAIPMVFAVAATSAGFTGQAIAVAFDRRYGALKRSGASGVPAWAIIVGKIIAVFAMVCLQVVVLGTASFLLGFRAPLTGVLLAFVVLLLGVAAFTALG